MPRIIVPAVAAAKTKALEAALGDRIQALLILRLASLCGLRIKASMEYFCA